MSRYLFISAHCDDYELSCGGTIAKLKDQGHEVSGLAFSDCKSSIILSEFRNASLVLGIDSDCLWWPKGFYGREQDIANELYLHWNNFDYVFTHSGECTHSDHRIIGEQSRRVFKSNLITYIQPWNGAQPENYFVELTGDQLEKKINALYCYRSQSHRPYMSSEFIHAQAVYNGIKCGKKYAEAFKIERLIQ